MHGSAPQTGEPRRPRAWICKLFAADKAARGFRARYAGEPCLGSAIDEKSGVFAKTALYIVV